jgi:carbamoyl-phosphate synthase large subunit
MINNFNDLNYSLITPDHIIQPFLDGDIITIDIINDRTNNFEYCARKELIRSSNGLGLTVQYLQKDVVFYNIIFNIINLIKIHGLFNIELILYKNDYYLLDINPRPSAGLIFSKIYGFNFVTQLIAVFRNDILINNFSHSGINIIKRYYNELY